MKFLLLEGGTYGIRIIIKWHIHCPCMRSFSGEKVPSVDSEVDCKKCKSTLEVLVKEDIVSVRPHDHQG